MSERLNILFNEDNKPWYKEGLRFKCTGCGQCCTGAPGYVWVTDEEIEAIANHLKVDIIDFHRRYVRQVGNRKSLLEDPRSYDCIFLKENKCQIYSLRPKQCRTFPWWVHNLETEAQWQEAARHCEGINHPNAPVVPFETIKKELES